MSTSDSNKTTTKARTCKIQCIFTTEDRPADWRGTPDSNCLCCDYISALFIRKGNLYI